eukprot:TRINITY_DN16014_c0_g1_i1.p1 TRINITY_DN16014_c0_g1~~TRINITY_DN16014_c0_g1_i1.p1  ORF type:complete len:962 (+),score=199.69 TRINITY_DN16014_c0_g1_i1:78-2888(+)
MEAIMEPLSPPAPAPVGIIESAEPLSAELQEVFQRARLVAQEKDASGADAAFALLQGLTAPSAANSALAAAWRPVLDAYVRQERFDAAVELACHLMHKGSSGASLLLPTQLDAVLRALGQARELDLAIMLLRTACSAGAVPGDTAFNGVLDAAVRARAYSQAWEILDLLLSSKRRADKYFVSILTKSLESSQERRLVKRGIALVDLFIQQQREDVDEIVFNSLLNVLGHIGDMPRLQQTLDKMQEYGVQPSAVTYGTVVKAYGRARDIESVLRVWSEMRARCLGVNPVTCGCVLDACVKCGHLDEAMSIFQEMRWQGFHKNTVLYATLIKGLAKTRDLASAVQLYQDMRMEGVACNLVTFNSLMDVCVRCGDLTTAALFLQDMMQMGIEPDLITFSTLIKGYSHIGEVHKALALRQELKARNLKCDEIMYNSLINGCVKAGLLQEGMSILEDMCFHRVAPSNITFSILVKLHFEAKRPSDAFRLVESMSSRYHCPPTRVVYNVLLRCSAAHGGEALVLGAKLLSELASRRGSRIVDQAMLVGLAVACIAHGDLDTAISLVRDFAVACSRRASVLPQENVHAVFEALGAMDKAPQGHQLLQELADKGLAAAQLPGLRAAIAEGARRGPAEVGVGVAVVTAPLPVELEEEVGSLGALGYPGAVSTLAAPAGPSGPASMVLHDAGQVAAASAAAQAQAQVAAAQAAALQAAAVGFDPWFGASVQARQFYGAGMNFQPLPPYHPGFMAQMAAYYEGAAFGAAAVATGAVSAVGATALAAPAGLPCALAAPPLAPAAADATAGAPLPPGPVVPTAEVAVASLVPSVGPSTAPAAPPSFAVPPAGALAVEMPVAAPISPSGSQARNRNRNRNSVANKERVGSATAAANGSRRRSDHGKENQKENRAPRATSSVSPSVTQPFISATKVPPGRLTMQPPSHLGA